MKRWTSRYPYLGVVSISFTLPEEYEPGWWTIRAQVLNQVEEKRILLERWYTERFDVYVSMPPYAMTSDEYFEGDISANFTAVAPTYGNLTVRVILKPFSASTKSRKPIALLDKFIEDYVHDVSFSEKTIIIVEARIALIGYFWIENSLHSSIAVSRSVPLSVFHKDIGIFGIPLPIIGLRSGGTCERGRTLHRRHR